MISDACGCCTSGPGKTAPCHMVHPTWCPVCDKTENRRRCLEGPFMDADPLKELNRCCDKGCDFLTRSSRHSQALKTDLNGMDKRITQMYSLDVASNTNGYYGKHHQASYSGHQAERSTHYPEVCKQGFPYRSENPRSHYYRRDEKPSAYFNRVAGDSVGASRPLSFSERERNSVEMREKYIKEMEVLRYRLNMLKDGGYDGKRLRQRSESEPGISCSLGSRLSKKARDDSCPSIRVPHRILPAQPQRNHHDTFQYCPPREFKRETKSLPPVGSTKVPVRSSPVRQARYREHRTHLPQAKAEANESDSEPEASSCGEDTQSQEEQDGNISEDDNRSVGSSVTSGSNDSNTPSRVGETLGTITLNEPMSAPMPSAILKPGPSLALTKQPSPFRSSLFANVPPYIKFFLHDYKGPTLPSEITRRLKWKLSTITPIVIRRTLVNSGFKLVRSESVQESNDWTGQWGKHMKSFVFKTLKDFQKLNHFPGTFQIGRKDRLWKNLYRLMMKFGKKEFGFIPRTYILPQDSKLLRAAWEKAATGPAGHGQWIVKPPAAARGTGIKVVHKWNQIPKKRPLIVQKYIGRPYLINGSKFDLRLYVLMTSIHPLRIYLYDDGLVRFASVRYSDDLESLSDRFMHLTNYSINKLSNQYCANEDASACRGHKWTLKSLWSYLEKTGVDVKPLQRSLTDLVIKTIISGEGNMSVMTKNNLPSRYCSYELFGIDVLLDERLTPWLLEVNISPSLHSASPLDLAVKGPLVRDLLNVAGFQIPGKLPREQEEAFLTAYGLKDRMHTMCYDKRLYWTTLSKAERMRHDTYHPMTRREYLTSILDDLSPDDIRHLVQFEDELTQIGRFEKVFPTPHTHVYHQFFDSPRYYNMMLDAWETRYHKNRLEGIRLLDTFCQQKLHLTVPFPGGKATSSVNPSELMLPAPPESESEAEVVELAGDISKPSSPLKGKAAKTRVRPVTRASYVAAYRCRPSVAACLSPRGETGSPVRPRTTTTPCRLQPNYTSCNLETTVMDGITKALSPVKQMTNCIKLKTGS